MIPSVSEESSVGDRRFSKSLPELKSESETSVHLSGLEPVSPRSAKSILQRRRSKTSNFEDLGSTINLPVSNVASNDSLLSDFAVLLDDLSLQMREEARTSREEARKNFAKLEQRLDKFVELMESPSRQHVCK
ncbi:unnamed protein product, partial [Polarella glacialis]